MGLVHTNGPATVRGRRHWLKCNSALRAVNHDGSLGRLLRVPTRYLPAMRPSTADILAAAHRLRGVVERTPLVHSPALSAVAGTGVYLKCENLQRTGSFKLRGAYNALALLSPEQRERGVVASSAGNHGLGVAYSAKRLGMRALIFVPSSAPRVKRDGIVALGAQVDEAHSHYDAAHHAAMEFAERNDMTFVNPCAGRSLLAGQGTVGVEIAEELPGVRTLIVPVGGGGLVGGIGAFARGALPHTRIVGAQGDRSNAMAVSLEARRVVEVPVSDTLADGLSGQIDEDGLAAGLHAIDEMRVVRESEIAEAIVWLAAEHDMRVEGSGAVGIAAVRSSPSALTGPVVVVLSGGNIDAERWQRVLQEQR